MMANLNWSSIKNFVPNEFQSPDLPGSGQQMNLGFVLMLDKLRDRVSLPFKIDSGFRTASWNKKVGGVANSAHCRGLAVDIRCGSGMMRFLLVKDALEMGFTRIGIGSSFVHLDMDPENPQQVIWLYSQVDE